ncbi:MAG: hypothetical protein PWP08_492 [Methanofollis sp.]|nr:hypothetical protein [Methanofollis sp.]
MRATGWMATLVVVGAIAVGALVVLCETGSEYRDTQPSPLSLFSVSNQDDVPHEVVVTVYNMSENHTRVCSETYRLEADGYETSSFKNEGEAEYRFEVSIDDRTPQEFTFYLQRCHSLDLSIRTDCDVRALVIESDYASPNRSGLMIRINTENV